jgi:hypothetical protein
LIGQANTPEIAEDVSVVGSYGYITGLGLHVVDISNPANPQIVGSVPTYSTPRALAVVWPHVYVAGSDFEQGLDVINVANPTSPVVVGSLHGTGRFPSSVAVSNAYALVTLSAFSDGRLAVFDVSNPAAPAFAGGIQLSSAWDVAVSGRYAFVADGAAGLTVLDILSPNQPVIVGSVATGGFTEGVMVSDDFAYVCAPFATPDFQVFDISNPTSPSFLGGATIPGDPTDVMAIGNFAYIADRDGSLAVVDVTDSGAPVFVGSVATGSGANAVALASPNVVVADTFGGLLIYPPQCVATASLPSETATPVVQALYPNFPNPFSDHTLIRFVLAQSVPVSLRIYDSSGRLVRSLESGIREAGENRVPWNGRSDRGERLAGGVYFYRLEAAAVQETRSLVLID